MGWISSCGMHVPLTFTFQGWSKKGKGFFRSSDFFNLLWETILCVCKDIERLCCPLLLHCRLLKVLVILAGQLTNFSQDKTKQNKTENKVCL